MREITPLIKKHLLPNIPYIVLFWFGCKLGEAYRLADGVNFLQRVTHSVAALKTAMASPLPVFNSFDLMAGMAFALLIFAVVYQKKQNAKKYRKDVEYGSARWSA